MVKTDKERMKGKNEGAKRIFAARQTRVIAPLLTHGSLESRLQETEIWAEERVAAREHANRHTET